MGFQCIRQLFEELILILNKCSLGYCPNFYLISYIFKTSCLIFFSAQTLTKICDIAKLSRIELFCLVCARKKTTTCMDKKKKENENKNEK